jgi:16S rRNA (guanine527-N7)-methyltransferase
MARAGAPPDDAPAGNPAGAGLPHHTLSGPALAGLALELDLELTPQQSETLVQYAELLRRWNRVHNLTSVDSDDDLLTHHLLDCLAIVRPIERAMSRYATGLLPGRPVHYLDAGSGAGLPGIPLAVARPHWQGVLVDAVQKKCAFLQQAQVELRLANIAVRHARLETATLGTHDIIVSRAFASLRDFVTLTRPLLRPNGLWIAMKGRNPSNELADLPDGIEAIDTSTLRVPQLAEQRHLVVLRPAPHHPADAAAVPAGTQRTPARRRATLARSR